MSLMILLPLLAAALFLIFTVSVICNNFYSRKKLWILPAGLSLIFLFFSINTVLIEGPFGFWTDHTRNLWGNQIWFDLLLAVGIAWFLIVPQAKALGMRLWPWLLLIVATGCIGFLAMVARLLYLRECSEKR